MEKSIPFCRSDWNSFNHSNAKNVCMNGFLFICKWFQIDIIRRIILLFFSLADQMKKWMWQSITTLRAPSVCLPSWSVFLTSVENIEWHYFLMWCTFCHQLMIFLYPSFREFLHNGKSKSTSSAQRSNSSGFRGFFRIINRTMKNC